MCCAFTTPEDASAAAADMAGKSTNIQTKYNGLKPTHPIPIPRHPGTNAVTYDGFSRRLKKCLCLHVHTASTFCASMQMAPKELVGLANWWLRRLTCKSR